MSQQLLRAIVAITGLNVVLTGYNIYTCQTLLERNYEDSEARLDEVEGTLRGHIGLIEDSLERIEGVLSGAAGVESGWGKGLSKKAEEFYMARGRDEKGKDKKK